MSLSKSWDLQIDPDVLKALKALPRRDAERILGMIRFLPLDPYFGDIRKMKGEEDANKNERKGDFGVSYGTQNFDDILNNSYVQKRYSHC